MVEKELEEVFGFFVLVSNDTTRETWIHVQSLFTCDGMNADNRMLVNHLINQIEKHFGHIVLTSVSMGSLRTGPLRLRESSAI